LEVVVDRITRGVALLAAAGLAAATAPRMVSAQRPDSSGVLVGYVADQFGEPVVDAELLLVGVGAARMTRTAAAGVYRLEDVPAGVHQVRVRRTGYLPALRPVAMKAGDTRIQEWEIRRLPPSVDPRAIQTDDGEMRVGLQAFNERRENATGTFIDRAEIEQRNPSHARELLRGVSGFRLASGGSGDAVMWSGGPAGSPVACRAQMFVEGLPYTPLTGIDDFAPEDIEAIEAYPAGSPVAAELKAGSAECGMLLIWLRR
jgi:hypothetical protein